jgi:predicted alpha/beta superfamily hydrolase
LKTVKSLVIVLILCIFTVGFSWFSAFNLLGVFIDKPPHTVGNSFYISEIILTFTLYFLGSYLAIISTKLPPFIAAIPVGTAGLIFYYIELGGLDCVGVCGMPFWYDVVSFFKHMTASLFAIAFFLIIKRFRKDLSSNKQTVNSSNWFSKLSVMKSIAIVFSLFVFGILIVGKVIFDDLSANASTVSIYSDVLQEQRNVTVFLPSGYSSSDKPYDVLYTLDGENPQHNYLAAATVKILAYLGFTPEMITVAIKGQGKRGRDFRLKGAVDVFGNESSGDASRFHEFLDNELIPNIEKNFRTGERKLIAGHSYGGLFTAYSFTKHRNSFDGYFSFSPSFQDSDTSIVSFKKGLKIDLNKKKFIYLNLGLEVGVMRGSFKQVETALSNSKINTIHSKISYFSLPHALIMIPGYFEALSEFYRK